MNSSDTRKKIRQILSHNLPSPVDRRVVLEILAAGIERADTYGDDRWVVKAVFGSKPLVRFHVGPVIIQSVVPNGIWLSLDRRSFQEIPDSDQLHLHLSWSSHGFYPDTYPTYRTIDSRNAYIYPGGVRWEDFRRTAWPELSRAHFESIERAARRNKNGVGQRTGKGHQPEVLDVVGEEVQRHTPRPCDWT